MKNTMTNLGEIPFHYLGYHSDFCPNKIVTAKGEIGDG